MNILLAKYKQQIKYPLADSGYGSLENYLFNLNNTLELVQKYGMYEKDKDSNYRKKNSFKSRNFENNPTGQPIYPAGKEMEYVKDVKGRYQTTLFGTKRYAGIGCSECPLQSKCTRSKTGIRQIEMNTVLYELEVEVQKNLASDHGIKLRVKRSIQAEVCFAQLKIILNLQEVKDVGY